MTENDATLSFEGQVAIVSGAGGGLGRSHALMLAARGAKVLVNDIGRSLDGRGENHKHADAVVAEIQAAGGEATANYDSVSDAGQAAGIVQQAIDTFGRIDIVINNAGILRDSSFSKITEEQWQSVIDVHLNGSMWLSHAAWPHMKQHSYGRIIFTSSAAGLYGNFGQSNYSAAKMALVGLCKTLAHEGAKYSIRCNAVAPIARSRMTETILPPDALERLDPSIVSALVSFLCSKACDETGRVFTVGAHRIARAEVVENAGVLLDPSDISLESVKEQWENINDISKAEPVAHATDAIRKILVKVP
ncbi:MAG: SDR family oxidoreductase [Myxococcales bacterium]|nr:MAG: SDR family oxidoreductase [Myxococcales bacterium]